MPFVKLDCGILDSTIWYDRDAREVFLTALLMAYPGEIEHPEPQINVRDLEPTGWSVPPGWYGMVPAAGVGIIARAKVEQESGLTALERLGSPEPDSRSKEFEGRRLVRIDGGYCVLNFMRYRERDYTTAERSKRYRERKKASKRHTVTSGRDGVTARDVTVKSRRVTPLSRRATEAEAEAEASTPYSPPEGAVGVSRKHLPVKYEDIKTRIAAVMGEVAAGTRRALDAEQARELQVEMVFAFWAGKLGHEGSMLDSKRSQRITARLTENGGNVHELLFVIDGAKRDSHIMGRNQENRKFDGIDTLFRDRGQVERLAELGGYKSGLEHPLAQKYAAVCAE